MMTGSVVVIGAVAVFADEKGGDVQARFTSYVRLGDA